MRTYSAGMTANGAPAFPDYGGGAQSSTNGLQLQITGITNGVVSLNLNNATDIVYEVWTKTSLTQTSWNIETEVFSTTNQQVMPFTIAQQGRGNLFVWARDWTGITSHGNTVPEWWFWEYFYTVDMSDTNLDFSGNTLLHDYTNQIVPINTNALWLEALPPGTNAYNSNPNALTFILQFTTNASSYQLMTVWILVVEYQLVASTAFQNRWG